ncbi:MAG: sulfotransferase [Cyanobacteriota bacterium]|nr:sulfotransferase [Cyanobacteriota bacterium]
MTYRKLFIVGCPRSGTSWLTRMISFHPNILKVPSESHAYSLTYHYFTYLKKQKLKKRFKLAIWILKFYGLKPLLFGFRSEDLWQGIFKHYEIYQKGTDGVGIHNLVSYIELE